MNPKFLVVDAKEPTLDVSQALVSFTVVYGDGAEARLSLTWTAAVAIRDTLNNVDMGPTGDVLARLRR